MNKTLLFVIATGQRYWPYTLPLLASADKYFLLHDTLLFTDCPMNLGEDLVRQVRVQAKGYPGETLWRYHTLLSQADAVRRYDHVFYCDVDMLFVDRVGEEVLSGGITATLHAGYLHPSKGNNFTIGAWEERPQSAACVPSGRGKRYFAGGFNGGATGPYLKMASDICRAIDVDHGNGVLAQWHDESHLNRYLHDNPPALALSPSYCYPEPLHFTNPDPDVVRRGIEMMREAGLTEHDIWKGEVYLPKILALEKRWRT